MAESYKDLLADADRIERERFERVCEPKPYFKKMEAGYDEMKSAAPETPMAKTLLGRSRIGWRMLPFYLESLVKDAQELPHPAIICRVMSSDSSGTRRIDRERK